jgi:hypothetical protein
MSEEKGEILSADSIPLSYGLTFASIVGVLIILFSWIFVQPGTLASL